jgi:hypothetical protein
MMRRDGRSCHSSLRYTRPQRGTDESVMRVASVAIDDMAMLAVGGGR